MPQLWDAGPGREPGTGPYHDRPSLSPSGLFLPHVGSDLMPKPECAMGEPMTAAEIDGVVEAFAAGAVAAQAMGCDGVNIHGAHGYLIDQFFWTRSNRRDDHHGGSLANRTRLAAAIVAEIRRRTGPDFPIFFRLSQWKTQDYAAKIAATPDELAAILEPLAHAGVDLFDCSTRRFWEPEYDGSSLNLAGWAKQLTGVPTMTVGSVGLDGDFMTATHDGIDAYLNAGDVEVSAPASLDRLLERLDAGEFDPVAVGRALIANPAWTDIVRDGDWAALKPYSRNSLLTLN